MDYYRRYIGDYLKKTGSLTMIEDGAYTRLLDAYYGSDGPLDPASVNTIAKALTQAERKAVADVVAKFFYLGADGLLHNPKADEELGIALPKIEKLRETARTNGAKSKGRPKKPKPVPSENQAGLSGETESGSKEKPDPVSKKPDPVSTRDVGQPPTASPNPKPPSEQRCHGGGGTEATHQPLALAEARIDPETPTGILASVCVANGIRVTAFHPLVVEWARDGVTPDRLRSAIATAKMRKGEESIPPAYLDRILGDEPARAKPSAWRGNDGEARKLCAQLGIKPDKVGESREAWHQRIEQALAEQARQRVA